MRQKKLETEEKKVVKKTTKKTIEKVDIKQLEISAGDVAFVIGVTTPNITNLVQTGVMKRNENGKFNLVENVSNYCRSLRERKAGTGKSDLELENLALKNEKLKESLRTWRMQRDREVAMAILEAQRNAMNKLRDQCNLVPALTQVIDGMINCINKVDIDNISYTVEGENEDGEEI